jgi:hypothetical protein
VSRGSSQTEENPIRVYSRKSAAELMSHVAVARAFRYFETHADEITEEQIRICSVPASPFDEQERAEYLQQKNSEL